MTYQIISVRRLRKKAVITDPADVFALIKRYAKAEQELIIVITLNCRNEVISVSIVSIGTIGKTIVHPREVFNRAVKDMAKSIIVCHNHPSGSVTPSPQDNDITKTLFEAGEVLMIPLVDHIVFSRTGYYSLKQHGMFPRKEKV